MEGQRRHAHTAAAAAGSGDGGRVGGTAAPAQEDRAGAGPLPAVRRVVAVDDDVFVGPAFPSRQRCRRHLARAGVAALGAAYVPVRVRALRGGGQRPAAGAPAVAAALRQRVITAGVATPAAAGSSSAFAAPPAAAADDIVRRADSVPGAAVAAGGPAAAASSAAVLERGAEPEPARRAGRGRAAFAVPAPAARSAAAAASEAVPRRAAAALGEVGGRDQAAAEPHATLARHLRLRRGRRHGVRPRGLQAPRRERAAQLPGPVLREGPRRGKRPHQRHSRGRAHSCRRVGLHVVVVASTDS